MMKHIALLVSCVLLFACNDARRDGDSGDFIYETSGVKKKKVEGFGGVIAEKYSDSEEWWPPEERPEKDAPNAIIFLLDDVGFAQIGSFGGLIETPNIDRLAENGLRFNNFHTTALCSPSRATLMAGRYRGCPIVRGK